MEDVNEGVTTTESITTALLDMACNLKDVTPQQRRVLFDAATNLQSMTTVISGGAAGAGGTRKPKAKPRALYNPYTLFMKITNQSGQNAKKSYKDISEDIKNDLKQTVDTLRELNIFVNDTRIPSFLSELVQKLKGRIRISPKLLKDLHIDEVPFDDHKEHSEHKEESSLDDSLEEDSVDVMVPPDALSDAAAAAAYRRAGSKRTLEDDDVDDNDGDSSSSSSEGGGGEGDEDDDNSNDDKNVFARIKRPRKD